MNELYIWNRRMAKWSDASSDVAWINKIRIKCWGRLSENKRATGKMPMLKKLLGQDGQDKTSGADGNSIII